MALYHEAFDSSPHPTVFSIFIRIDIPLSIDKDEQRWFDWCIVQECSWWEHTTSQEYIDSDYPYTSPTMEFYFLFNSIHLSLHYNEHRHLSSNA